MEADARTLLGKHETDVPILADRDGAAMDAYGISFDLPEMLRPMYAERMGFPGRNPATGWRLPVPATFVVDTMGVIPRAPLPRRLPLPHGAARHRDGGAGAVAA